MHKFSIGVDIGGTRTKSGLVNLETGEVLHHIIHPTEKNDESAFLELLGSAIAAHQLAAAKHRHHIAGIGFGVPSFVTDEGLVDSTYGFLPFMENYPLVKSIENKFHLRCRVDNDARVVALGEALYGQGKGFARVLVLTLGTGLGVGFIKHSLFHDALPVGHMAGHIKITDNENRCYCGKTGCLESLVSSAGIQYIGKKIRWEENYPLLPLSSETVFAESLKGNKDAQKIVEELLGYLHTGIHNYINLFAPDLMVLGGGMARGVLPHLAKLMEGAYLKPYQKYAVALRASELQEHAGIVGSAALFR